MFTRARAERQRAAPDPGRRRRTPTIPAIHPPALYGARTERKIRGSAALTTSEGYGNRGRIPHRPTDDPNRTDPARAGAARHFRSRGRTRPARRRRMARSPRMALDRTHPRRPRARSRRPPHGRSRLLPGHRRRRRLEDRGRRGELAERLRRLLRHRLRRGRRGQHFPPRNRLRRHGRDVLPRQRLAR